MRLWDLRKMRTSYEFEEVESRHYGAHNFDYRFITIPYLIYPKLTTDFTIDIRLTQGQNTMPIRRTAAS